MSPFVVVENTHSRVTAEGEPPYFDQVTLWTRDENSEWREEIAWTDVEWQEKVNEAFEAILGVIAKVAKGERVVAP